MSKMTIQILIVTLIFSPCAFTSPLNEKVENSAYRTTEHESFNDVWRKVSLSPWEKVDQWGRPQTLPQYSGVGTGDLIELLLKAFTESSGDMDDNWPFAVRSRELFTNSANFKEVPNVKWLHPRGVCAKGQWIIPENSESPASGLFEPGTKVPVIVRFSSGTNASERLIDGTPQDRLFGLAIKIFHSNDPDEPTVTSNIVTLDQKGFSRTVRPHMLQADEKEGELYYTNVAPVESIIGSDKPLKTFAGKLLSRALDIFDTPNFARPVYVTASVDTSANLVSNPKVPFELRFIPNFPSPSQDYEDFRFELLDYQRGNLDIVIQKMNEDDPSLALNIGRIEFEAPMLISGNCDLRLSFHHSPNDWKKEYETDLED